MAVPTTSKRSRADVKHAVDLLWAHQLRKENALIHENIKQLQTAVESISDREEQDSLMTKELRTTTNNHSTLLNKIETDQSALIAAVEAVHQHIQHASDCAKFLRADLAEHQNESKASVVQIKSDIDAIKQMIQESKHEYVNSQGVKKSLVSLKTSLEEGFAKMAFPNLEEKVNRLEEKLTMSLLAKNLIENGTRDGNPPDISVPPDDCRMSPALDPLIFSTSGDHCLMTRPKLDIVRSSDTTEIDLDENVSTLSYARAFGHDSAPSDSFSMITQSRPTGQSNLEGINHLKQGRLHSFKRYLAEGQALSRRMLTQHEETLVRRFVDGLYNKNQAQKCLRWLELHGMSWVNVEQFSIKFDESASQSLEIPASTFVPENGIVSDSNFTVNQHQGHVPSKETVTKSPQIENGKNQGQPRRSQRLCDKASVSQMPAFEPRGLRSQTLDSKLVPSHSISKRKRPETKGDQGRAKNKKAKGAAEQKLANKQTNTAAKVRESIRNQTRKRLSEKHNTRAGDLRPTPTVTRAGSNKAKGKRLVRQPTPRLVMRENIIERKSEEASSYEGQLLGPSALPSPQLPSAPKMNEQKKYRSLQLPAPPLIPILPTSDD